MVEWPLVHPWWGGCHWWRAHLRSSSRIWPLWGHDLVCQANHSGWACAPSSRGGGLTESAAILVRCLWEKANIDMVSPCRSNLISVLVLDGRQLRASARSIFLPGQYIMTRSYCCRWRSILWSRAGAAVRFFKLIILRGLWSVSTMNVLLYRYVWNFSQPYMMAKSSLSMLA